MVYKSGIWVLGKRVFEITKKRHPILEKVIEEFSGFGGGGGIKLLTIFKVGKGAGVVWEVFFYIVTRTLKICLRRWKFRLWWDVVFGEALAIVSVKREFTTQWFLLLIHEDVEAFSLEGIEVGLKISFFGVEEFVGKGWRSQK